MNARELPLPTADHATTLENLRAAGAARFDPPRFAYLEALANRTARQPESVREILAPKLSAALAEFECRFAAATRTAQDVLAVARVQHPQAAAELDAYLVAGDFAALHRRVAQLERGTQAGPLAELVRHAGHHAAADETMAVAEAPAVALAAAPMAPTDLKAVSHFRDTWSKLSVERQINHAIGQAPAQAGPFNSHHLVLRSLERMRDVSPDYLRHFLAYAETLLRLDQVAERPAVKPGATKKPATKKSAMKKPATTRSAKKSSA
jgi:hypothetical protein